ncbi:DNA replication and repair protein RecF [Trueperella bonasi]|uniref:DNA replication and repair protein RecF n=1 Tax=Trueperella bonasi TaxID=312286 RepID=A0ABT9NG29_9ACTO|nr:DNA replication/repair protein RecF [Trueperella bonasi]MDP9806341.1 DNA replication and repair protein RecF [Trueperella bonasi]
MYISDLALHDFRSYREVVLELEPGVVIFVGENGQGKTNLVEAIGYLATFTSHRVAADTALVRQGASAAVVRAKVCRGDSETIVEIEILTGKANRARINRGNVRPAELLGIVRAVVFAPEDLELIKGDPGARRRFLDNLMIQFRPRLAAVKSEYDKALRQRGALLKTMQKARRRGGFYDEAALEIWDAQIAKFGAQIIAERAKIIAGLRPLVEKYYADVSGGRGIARIDYGANLDERRGWVLPSPQELVGQDGEAHRAGVAEHETELQDAEATERAMLATLRQWHDEEIERGVNLVGPHRDELELSLGTLPAKGFASHGESWSYALALRLASWKLLCGQEGDWAPSEEPILILDDVFAELDSRRRARLADIVKEAEQVFVTAAVGEDLPELGGTRFVVHDGVVTGGGG